jgi:hypothetical protein
LIGRGTRRWASEVAYRSGRIIWMPRCIDGFSFCLQMSKRVRLKTSGKGSLGAAAAEHAHALMTAAVSNGKANRTSGNVALARLLAEEAQMRAAEQLARSKAHTDGVNGGGHGGGGGGGHGGGGGGGGFADSAAPKAERDDDGSDRGDGGEERGGSAAGADTEKGVQEQGGTEGKVDADQLSQKKRRRKGKSSNSTESTPAPGSKESREAWKLKKELARAKRQEKGMNYDPDAFWLAAEWTGDLQNRSKHFHTRGYEDNFDMVGKVHAQISILAHGLMHAPVIVWL